MQIEKCTTNSTDYIENVSGDPKNCKDYLLDFIIYDYFITIFYLDNIITSFEIEIFKLFGEIAFILQFILQNKKNKNTMLVFFFFLLHYRAVLPQGSVTTACVPFHTNDIYWDILY